MLRPRHTALFLGSAVAALGLAASRCSFSDPPIAATDAGADIVDGSVPDNKPPQCKVLPRPANVPAGWELAKNVDPCCGFYTPTAIEQMPPPIAWEPCPSDHVPAGSTCRQMAVDWPRDGNTRPLWVEDRAAQLRGDGNVTLLFERFGANGRFELMADSDGVVRVALMNTLKYGCVAAPRHLSSDRYGFAVKFPGTAQGMIVGDLSSLSPLGVLSSESSESWLPGLPGVLHVAPNQDMNLIPWDKLGGGPSIHISSPAEEDGRQQSFPFFEDQAIFWNSTTLAFQGFRVWTPMDGKQSFIDYGGDYTRGVHGLGSDGADLVWNEGEGRTNPNDVFPTNWVMTSPFTTDPKALKPRKVRQTGAYGAVDPYRVGCGYAAHVMGLTSSDAYAEVIRLSDGVAWRFVLNRPMWTWNAPIAITCDEIFLHIQSKGPLGTYEESVARIRLDSLGPGIPP